MEARLLKQTPGTMRAVIAPKLAPVQALGSCLAAAPLQAMLLFSSVSSLAGFAGHANYCAGNATADAAASFDAQRGMPTLAVQWGAWSGVGALDCQSVGNLHSHAFSALHGRCAACLPCVHALGRSIPSNA